MQSRTFWRISVTAVILLSLWLLIQVGQKATQSIPFPDLGGEAAPASSTEAIYITAPGGIIHALQALTPAEQQLGLGQRDALPADAGMLFVFTGDQIRGFWMKDMRFAIDMVWIDAGEKVTGVTARVSPETYPDLFLSPGPARYVLELNAGGAEKFGIATGTQLAF